VLISWKRISCKKFITCIICISSLWNFCLKLFDNCMHNGDSSGHKMLYFFLIYFYYYYTYFLYFFYIFITHFSLNLLDFKKFFKYFMTFYSAYNFAFMRSTVTPTYVLLQNPRVSSRGITDGRLIPSHNPVDRGKTNLLEFTVHSTIISYHLDCNSRERRRRLSLFFRRDCADNVSRARA